MNLKKHTNRLLFVVLLSVCSVFSVQAKDVIKVLAIGNSFSEDAVEQYLYELAHANGDSLVIGNAYIGGCPIALHWQNAVDNAASYRYRKIIGGKKITISEKTTMLDLVTDEDWDYITFQQASHFSGIDSTYVRLPQLLSFVRKNATNPKVEFMFHQTWAYSQDASHDGFKSYGRDQQQMYNAIMKTVKRVTAKNRIKRIIPAGTAIQNGRTSLLGDTFCRDGYHLSWGLGRYTAACTWLEVLTGKSAVGNSFVPHNVTMLEARIAQRAAHNAVRQPYRVTSLADYSEDYAMRRNIYFYDEPSNDYYMRDQCRLDVYYPKNKNGFTTVVWFHGGGLTEGERHIPRLLEEKGIAVVAVGYRLSPRVKHPTYIEDAAAAVNWVLKNIEECGGDASHVVVSGHSAGGYLAAMLALDKSYLGKYGVDADSMYMYHPLSAQCVTHYTIREEAGIPKDSWWIDRYAPIFHARKTTAPIYLTTGDRELEMALRYEENLMLKLNLERFGNRSVELHEFKNTNHGTMVEPGLKLLLEVLERE